jgi:hypothetical protein
LLAAIPWISISPLFFSLFENCTEHSGEVIRITF